MRPQTVRRCKACSSRVAQWTENEPSAISPNGVRHLLDKYGWTLCKRDAQRGGWVHLPRSLD